VNCVRCSTAMRRGGHRRAARIVVPRATSRRTAFAGDVGLPYGPFQSLMKQAVPGGISFCYISA
jgi:hypothetical protein